MSSRRDFVFDELHLDLCAFQFPLPDKQNPLRYRFGHLAVGSLQLRP